MEMMPLHIEQLDDMLPLVQLLNPKTAPAIIRERFEEMFQHANFYCFGCYEGEQLLGLSGAWMTTRLYSGKQIEIDNFIMNPELRSKGLGQAFLKLLHAWAAEQGCLTVELNSYVRNPRSHKFYMNNDYDIVGFHFIHEMEGSAMER